MDLDSDLCYFVPGVMVYVPAVRDWKVDERSALSTYAFVIADKPDAELLKLKNSRFVVEVICQPNSRKIARVSDAELADMVRVESAPDLREGDSVDITTGDWEGLTGVVERLMDERVIVAVILLSGVRQVELLREEVRPVGDKAA